MSEITLSYDGEVVVEHPAIPGSVNRGAGGNRRHWSKGNAEKQEWDGTFGFLFMKAKLPRKLRFVSVNVELQFYDPGTRRDSENFRGPISKPLADALVKGGWIPDDTDAYYVLERVWISDVKLARTRQQISMGQVANMVVRIAYLLDSGPAAPLSAGGADVGDRSAGGADHGMRGAGDDLSAARTDRPAS